MENGMLPNSNANIPTWSRTYGGISDHDFPDWHDMARWIEQTDDGGYIIGGYTTSFGAGGRDIWILKLTSLGIIEWQKTYGGNSDDEANHIQQTLDGGYIVAGYTSSFGSGPSDIWVLKLYPKGEVEWQKTYGGYSHENAWPIYQTLDEGYIVCGMTMSHGNMLTTWVLKLHQDGEVEWQRLYQHQEQGISAAYCVQQTDDGGYIIGAVHNPINDLNGRILKLSALGDIEWQYDYGDNKKLEGRHTEDIIKSIQQTDDGGYIVGAHTFSYGAGGADLWAIKLFSDGSIEWQKAYGGEMSEFVNSIYQTDDEGYIALCSTWTFGGNVPNLWIVKLHPNGEVEWQKVYGKGDDFASHIQQTNDGGYITSGSSASFRDKQLCLRQRDFWALKLSPQGNIGPDCDFIQSAKYEVTETNFNPKSSNFIPVETTIIPQSTHINAQNTDVKSKLICWNLHRPPLHVSLKRELNRGLFRGEAIHTISWNLIPANDQFVITEYRIYRKPAQDCENYQMIGTTPAGTYDYIDRGLKLEDRFEYVVTSVDADGYESPRSQSVKNE